MDEVSSRHPVPDKSCTTKSHDHRCDGFIVGANPAGGIK